MGSAAKSTLARAARRHSRSGRFPDTKFPILEAVKRAEAWWDKKGRHIVTNREFHDPDVGIKSGITRGLSWADLSGREKSQIVVWWHHEYVRAPMVHQGGLSEGDLRELWRQTMGRRK